MSQSVKKPWVKPAVRQFQPTAEAMEALRKAALDRLPRTETRRKAHG